MSAIVISVSYKGNEFFRAGYFVSVNYDDPMLLENPYPLQKDKLVRKILVDKPRVVHHSIDWEGNMFQDKNNVNEDNNSEMLIENPREDLKETGERDFEKRVEKHTELSSEKSYTEIKSQNSFESKKESGYMNLFLNSDIMLNPEILFGFQRNLKIYSPFQDV